MISSALDERYGRNRRSAGRFRLVGILAASAAAAVLVAWLVWAGLGGSAATLEARDTGHEILGDNKVRVSWSLTVEPGTRSSCAVQALNESFGVVGWKVIAVPASTARTRELTETVRTTEQAVTGLIYRCWPA